MGTCIICGASADGRICALHEEDVAFEFEGDRPEQLTRNRYYRGVVDGYADFGVFVEIGDSGVTGLLHESELDRRLESLPWEPGDEVYVQVTDVHDNGNVDLGWSIRQSKEEFRGRLVDDPSAASNAELPADDGQSEESGGGDGDDSGAASENAGAARTDGSARAASDVEDASRAEDATPTDDSSVADAELARATVASLSERVGDVVQVEGEVASVRQTGGPTIFEVADETGAVDCAAFEEAGVRAYPDVAVGDVVRLTGEVELRRDELQVETSALDVLAGDDREAVAERLESALDEQARPPEVEPLVEEPTVDAVLDDVVAAATEIRRAVAASRPVIVRHAATVDGYVAGAAIERAVLPLVRDQHAASDAEYHYVDRRPLEDAFYDMEAATGDVTTMLDNAERHGEKLPLFVLVSAGSTRESLDGYELLDAYGAKRVVVDGGHADEAVADAVDAIVNPTLADGGDPSVPAALRDGADADGVTTGVLAANVAAHVDPDAREDLAHLPAVTYWGDAPEAYADLAAEAGYDAEFVSDLREAIALEAFYQRYEDKREIVQDLLWDAGNADLASHVSGQFRTKLDDELDTAEPHVEEREVSGARFRVLDTEAFTHRFDFPPIDLLLDELHRRDDSSTPTVTLGVDEDEIRLRSTEPVDVRAVAEAVAEDVPDGGVVPKGSRDGRVEFLAGERERVLESVIREVSERL